MEEVLSVAKVVKVFDEGSHKVEVLRGVSMGVAAGEVVALEGPSGSGKTTLLSIMGCILSPTSGEVRVEGRLVDQGRPTALREARRQKIGFVFQQYNLFPALTALENVEYALNVKRVTGNGAREEALRVLETVGLKDRIHFLPRDLSGGQKQRVAIARALAGDPPILLADEPTAALDSTSGRAVIELLQRLAHQHGRAVVMVTHDPRVLSYGDRILHLEDGRLTREENGSAQAEHHFRAAHAVASFSADAPPEFNQGALS